MVLLPMPVRLVSLGLLFTLALTPAVAAACLMTCSPDRAVGAAVHSCHETSETGPTMRAADCADHGDVWTLPPAVRVEALTATAPLPAPVFMSSPGTVVASVAAPAPGALDRGPSASAFSTILRI